MADPFKIKIDTSGRTKALPPIEKRPAWRSPWFIGVCVVGLIVIGGLLFELLRAHPALQLQPIAVQTVKELEPLTFKAVVASKDLTPGEWVFSLEKTVEGATVDPQTGEFSWTPREDQGPGAYTLTLVITTTGSVKLTDEKQFQIAVSEDHQPPIIEPIEKQSVEPGSLLQLAVSARDPDVPARKLNYTLASGSARGAKIDPRTGQLEWSPPDRVAAGVHSCTVVVTEAVRAGLSSKQTFQIEVRGKSPAVEQVAEDRPAITITAPPPMPTVTVEKPAPSEPEPVRTTPATPKVPAASAFDAGDETLLALYKDKKLLLKNQYPAIRQVFADRFQREHEADLRQAFGESHDEMLAWLDSHRDIKEELFLAIDTQRDKVPEALALFKALKEQFPQKIEPYAQLAIATAVTWDNERSVYDYVPHQTRTKAKLPEGQLKAAENFKYLVDAENVMQGRVQLLPWEFLKHVVNHKTPQPERIWAMEQYLASRPMFGKCYKEVPYDTQMLETQGATCRLAGQDYTLPNIRSYGGVCAMQADFAARVGKSLGVPAEYVGGESRFGDRHAWVMWVELKQVTRNGIVFSLESFGRYNIDQYYVGDLLDPQTGAHITDRELELRLHALGSNPTAFRQAELVMQTFPMLCEKAELDVNEQLLFLREVTRLSPGSESSWVALSKLSRDGEIEKKHHKAMTGALDSLFTTFAQFPDFTWTVFDDLVAFQTDAKLRNKYYERLVVLYESAGRPDLACEARLKLTDHLLADKQSTPAIEGLAYTIKKFPSEGRYVPKMLDKLEAIAQDTPGSEASLVQFYQEFLPRVPRMRGSRPSEFCVEMFQRGIKRFQAAGQEQLAQALSAELAKIQAARPN